MLGFPQGDINAAHVSAPAIGVGSVPKILVGILNPPIVLNLVRIVRRTWSGISNFPESLNELISRFVRSQLQKKILFLFADDVGDIPVEPFPIVRRKLCASFGQHQRDSQRPYRRHGEEENQAQTAWIWIMMRTHR